ncbi:MAG TPA: carboxypeptidase-like regulatory domain-containing protein [Vicinamibacterales bacterium]|jgi:Carboxypeptidase regulatory-like domain|nr:carboxypeptidase-like regulatory domain-containing protein [Vicinamibacterales bacterium]
MWITGQIVDDRGRALPGVTIEALGLGAIGRRAAVSNARGLYVMQDLPPGKYTITFTRSGFGTLRRQLDRLSTYVATINACLQTGVAARSSE